MKKIFCFIISLFLLIFLASPTYAYSDTGHNQYEDIEIVSRDDVYLLVNSSLKTKKQNLEKVRWRLFGPSVYVKAQNVKVKYKKFDSFCRSNRTNNVLEYEYTLEFNVSSQISVDTSVTTGAEVGAKINAINLAVEQSIKQSIGATIDVGLSKEVNYTITIDPHTKVTMYITGDALLSQGAVKYFFFGIPVYKSNWEYIDVVTEFYELNEEIYN